VTRVRSTGTVRVALQVMTRGMAAHGFSTGGPPDLADAESEGASLPLPLDAAVALLLGSPACLPALVGCFLSSAAAG